MTPSVGQLMWHLRHPSMIERLLIAFSHFSRPNKTRAKLRTWFPVGVWSTVLWWLVCEEVSPRNSQAGNKCHFGASAACFVPFYSLIRSSCVWLILLLRLCFSLESQNCIQIFIVCIRRQLFQLSGGIPRMVRGAEPGHKRRQGSHKSVHADRTAHGIKVRERRARIMTLDVDLLIYLSPIFRSLRISTPLSDSACSSSAESSDCESTSHLQVHGAPVEILPGLFLGNAKHSEDSRALQKYNIQVSWNVWI